jgi:hypothetical protein
MVIPLTQVALLDCSKAKKLFSSKLAGVRTMWQSSHRYIYYAEDLSEDPKTTIRCLELLVSHDF